MGICLYSLSEICLQSAANIWMGRGGVKGSRLFLIIIYPARFRRCYLDNEIFIHILKLSEKNRYNKYLRI